MDLLGAFWPHDRCRGVCALCRSPDGAPHARQCRATHVARRHRHVGLHDAPSITPLAARHQRSRARAWWPNCFRGKTGLAFRYYRQRKHRPDKSAMLAHDVGRLAWWRYRADGGPLAETRVMALAPALAAAVCAAEAFAYHAGDHPMAGRRAAGLSLWRPGADWQADDRASRRLPTCHRNSGLSVSAISARPSPWLGLPALRRSCAAQSLLQDFDRLAPSNDSTSLLSFLPDVGRRKTRVVADWLEKRGFDLSKSAALVPGSRVKPTNQTSLCAASTMRLHGRR